MKYSEYLCENLKNIEGYTHCYFVAGGNIMHLLDAARTRFECIPVVNEVAAGIAAEYFNETNKDGKKAFAMVTAGPGLTNIVTAIAGSYLESRELLVLGGQVKTEDLKSAAIRQRGIQEIDGVSIVRSITTCSMQLNTPKSFTEIQEYLHQSKKPGPVFLEIPLDVQGSSANFKRSDLSYSPTLNADYQKMEYFISDLLGEMKKSERPIILLGGGLNRKTATALNAKLANSGIPIMTTWNGADRYGSDQVNYWGRPNTWGQRAANILIQQSDLLIAVGTRLGLQQTGFAWKEFAPLSKIFQIDIDENELQKGHPKIFRGLVADAAVFMNKFLETFSMEIIAIDKWRKFGENVINSFPLNDPSNETSDGYIDPYEFVRELSEQLQPNDTVIPCSSGGAFTVMYQGFKNKFGQTLVSNKGLASMGYGLSAAIGAAESTKERTILVEGDGGFAQNLQELGTLRQQNLNLKIFVFANNGYGSIRMTQRNYFGGAYLGCDVKTGLGIPNWEYISKAYDLPFHVLDQQSDLPVQLKEILNQFGPSLITVNIDPEQTYFPKINSRVLPDGNMASNPLHMMTPELNAKQISEFLPYLKDII